MHRLLPILLNPSILSMICLVGAVVWMMRDQRDRTRPLLVIAMVLNMFYGALLHFVMGKENSLVPWKYDYILSRLDAALGISASAIAPALQGAFHWPLQIVYWVMVPMMVIWFVVARRSQRTGSLVLAYVTVMLMGPTLYAVLPACGPMFAFGRHWLHPPVVAPVVIRFTGDPNAFPSLHFAVALLFVFLSGGRVSRSFSLAFLAATAMATISTGEHYIIDLIAGLAFGCFAANVGFRRVKASLLWLAVVLTWSLSVRWASGFWIAHADLLRIFAILTVASAASAVVVEWRRVSQPAAAPAQAPATISVEAAGAE